MQMIITLILALAVGVLFIVLFSQKQHHTNKDKIIEYLRQHGQAQNHQLRKYIGVSAKTIVNYCDELEKAGKIKQIGKTGINAHYTLNT